VLLLLIALVTGGVIYFEIAVDNTGARIIGAVATAVLFCCIFSSLYCCHRGYWTVEFMVDPQNEKLAFGVDCGMFSGISYAVYNISDVASAWVEVSSGLQHDANDSKCAAELCINLQDGFSYHLTLYQVLLGEWDNVYIDVREHVWSRAQGFASILAGILTIAKKTPQVVEVRDATSWLCSGPPDNPSRSVHTLPQYFREVKNLGSQDNRIGQVL